MKNFNTEETFRDIEGYEGLYKVSDNGTVYSVEREYTGGYGAVCRTGGRALKPHVNKYRQNRVTVSLCKDGKVRRMFISILVAKAFPEICGQWFEGCEVDHIDCDPMNNKADNLRCCTKSENMRNPITRRHLREAMDSEDIKEKKRQRMMGDNNPARRCMNDRWRENLGNSHRGRPNPKCRKKVVLERNKVVREFCSVSEAAEFLGTRVSDVSAVCNGRYSRVRGWTARYA